MACATRGEKKRERARVNARVRVANVGVLVHGLYCCSDSRSKTARGREREEKRGQERRREYYAVSMGAMTDGSRIPEQGNSALFPQPALLQLRCMKSRKPCNVQYPGVENYKQYVCNS